MLIYHGNCIAVDKPKILKSNRALDFGPGFYTTTNKNQATSFAEKVADRNNSPKGIISIYEINLREEQLQQQNKKLQKQDKQLQQKAQQLQQQETKHQNQIKSIVSKLLANGLSKEEISSITGHKFE